MIIGILFLISVAAQMHSPNYGGNTPEQKEELEERRARLIEASRKASLNEDEDDDYEPVDPNQGEENTQPEEIENQDDLLTEDLTNPNAGGEDTQDSAPQEQENIYIPEESQQVFSEEIIPEDPIVNNEEDPEQIEEEPQQNFAEQEQQQQEAYQPPPASEEPPVPDDNSYQGYGSPSPPYGGTGNPAPSYGYEDTPPEEVYHQETIPEEPQVHSFSGEYEEEIQEMVEEVYTPEPVYEQEPEQKMYVEHIDNSQYANDHPQHDHEHHAHGHHDHGHDHSHHGHDHHEHQPSAHQIIDDENEINEEDLYSSQEAQIPDPSTLQQQVQQEGSLLGSASPEGSLIPGAEKATLGEGAKDIPKPVKFIGEIETISMLLKYEKIWYHLKEFLDSSAVYFENDLGIPYPMSYIMVILASIVSSVIANKIRGLICPTKKKDAHVFNNIDSVDLSKLMKLLEKIESKETGGKENTEEKIQRNPLQTSTPAVDNTEQINKLSQQVVDLKLELQQSRAKQEETFKMVEVLATSQNDLETNMYKAIMKIYTMMKEVNTSISSSSSAGSRGRDMSPISFERRAK